MSKKKRIILYFELGDFLESLRCSIPVDGKYLPIQEVCHRTSMSVSTYECIKRGLGLI
jgi:hypothetical protein